MDSEMNGQSFFSKNFGGSSQPEESNQFFPPWGGPPASFGGPPAGLPWGGPPGYCIGQPVYCNQMGGNHSGFPSVPMYNVTPQQPFGIPSSQPPQPFGIPSSQPSQPFGIPSSQPSQPFGIPPSQPFPAYYPQTLVYYRPAYVPIMYHAAELNLPSPLPNKAAAAVPDVHDNENINHDPWADWDDGDDNENINHDPWSDLDWSDPDCGDFDFPVLSSNIGILNAGAKVKCRDKDDTKWREGEVVSTEPTKVRVNGWDFDACFDEVVLSD